MSPNEFYILKPASVIVRLRRAASLLWRRQCRQRRYVWIAIRPVDRGRRRLKLEPLQQRLILRMISEPFRHRDREYLVRQPFNNIANLQPLVWLSFRTSPSDS